MANLGLWSEEPYGTEALREGAVVLRGFALPVAAELLRGIGEVARAAEFRNMTTPGGHVMSVAMTNCGALGWVTDRSGYRYSQVDPLTGKPWPKMPVVFEELSLKAAAEAGFAGFTADACLINRYEIGTKMSLHQDKDEKDFGQPIVSVSLGLPATFQFGQVEQRKAGQKVVVRHGDVVVWGGVARLAYHGILPLKDGEHPETGRVRYNLTFRRAG